MKKMRPKEVMQLSQSYQKKKKKTKLRFSSGFSPLTLLGLHMVPHSLPLTQQCGMSLDNVEHLVLGVSKSFEVIFRNISIALPPTNHFPLSVIPVWAFIR